MTEWTTIKVTKATQERIRRMGVMGETYETVLERALDRLEELENEKRVRDQNPLKALISEPILA